MNKFRFYQGLFGIAVWGFVTYKATPYIREHFLDSTFTIIYYILYFLLFIGLIMFTIFWYKKMKNANKKY